MHGHQWDSLPQIERSGCNFTHTLIGPTKLASSSHAPQVLYIKWVCSFWIAYVWKRGVAETTPRYIFHIATLLIWFSWQMLEICLARRVSICQTLWPRALTNQSSSTFCDPYYIFTWLIFPVIIDSVRSYSSRSDVLFLIRWLYCAGQCEGAVGNATCPSGFPDVLQSRCIPSLLGGLLDTIGVLNNRQEITSRCNLT